MANPYLFLTHCFIVLKIFFCLLIKFRYYFLGQVTPLCPSTSHLSSLCVPWGSWPLAMSNGHECIVGDTLCLRSEENVFVVQFLPCLYTSLLANPLEESSKKNPHIPCAYPPGTGTWQWRPECSMALDEVGMASPFPSFQKDWRIVTRRENWTHSELPQLIYEQNSRSTFPQVEQWSCKSTRHWHDEVKRKKIIVNVNNKEVNFNLPCWKN